MKSFRKLLAILLALTAILCLFACGECEHADNDGDGKCDECGESFGTCTHEDTDNDGKCDECGETMSTGAALTIIEGTNFNFQIVKGDDVTVMAIKRLDELKDTLSDFDINVDIVDHNKGEIKDYEILVGTVNNRGEEYKYDKYTLGPKGYIIKAIGNKILITAGSDDALLTALTDFIENTLGLTKNTTSVTDVKFTSKNEVLKIQDDYRIESITVNGKDIKGYNIVVDSSNALALSSMKAAAEKLQNFFYENAGYYIPVITSNGAESSSDGAIYIKNVPIGTAGSTGFRARIDGENYFIECAHYNKFADAFDVFYSQNFSFSRDKEFKLKSSQSSIDISTVNYADFGAVGDGKTDDYQAIYDAHQFANEGGQKVCATAGKTYLMRNVKTPVIIKTDVDWKSAKFIFDDSSVTTTANSSYNSAKHNSNTYYFQVVSDYTSSKVSTSVIEAINAKRDAEGFVLRGLESGNPTTKIDFAPGYAAILTINNSKHTNYIRYGRIDPSGEPQSEFILVDAEGNIDPSTPLLFDYKEVTSISVRRVDDKAITIQNGVFESIASCVNTNGKSIYLNRGIQILRANVTVSNLKHSISGEIAKGALVALDEATGLSYVPDNNYSGAKTSFTGHAYSGFIIISNSNNVTIKKCEFQARVYYQDGTYDINIGNSNQVVFEDCKQTNFFEDGSTTKVNLSRCWGVAITNFCKNLEYKNCELTRFDAHMGVVNAKVSGGKLGIVRLIGGGEFILENVEMYPESSGAPIQLREDYGCSFNGTITIKNVTIKKRSGTTVVTDIISANEAYWDMGYQTFFPNIIVDNLTIEGATSSTKVNLVEKTSTMDNLNLKAPTRDILRNDPTDPNKTFKLYYRTKNPDAYIAKNITAEDGKFHGCSYTTENSGKGDGTYYVVITQKNQFIYNAPSFIEVKNCEGKGYTLQLYNAAFFKNTEIKATAANLKRVAVPTS